VNPAKKIAGIKNYRKIVRNATAGLTKTRHHPLQRNARMNGRGIDWDHTRLANRKAQESHPILSHSIVRGRLRGEISFSSRPTNDRQG
jgi:hypothetical protein